MYTISIAEHGIAPSNAEINILSQDFINQIKDDVVPKRIIKNGTSEGIGSPIKYIRGPK
jgi:hypothetical protein